jgi:cell division protein FtsQ
MATRALNPRRPVAGRKRRPQASAPNLRRRPADRGALLRRRAIAAAVLLLVLYGGYMLWFRNLSWFAVNEVTVDGATTSQRQLQSALEQVRGDMTTLHLNDDQLRQAVARFPTVASLSASTSFPHTLHVKVTERLPVAYVRIHGQDTAVSADGYLLQGLSFHAEEMPRIDGAGAHGARLDGDAAAQAAILGATPESLRKLITSSNWN